MADSVKVSPLSEGKHNYGTRETSLQRFIEDGLEKPLPTSSENWSCALINPVIKRI